MSHFSIVPKQLLKELNENTKDLKLFPTPNEYGVNVTTGASYGCRGLKMQRTRPKRKVLPVIYTGTGLHRSVFIFI